MHSVSVTMAKSRPLAAIRARMPIAQVPGSFAQFLTPVYDASRQSGLKLDGQNVFLYDGDSGGLADVTFGVGVAAPFAPIGRVAYAETPAGEVATVTHWGDYAGLGAAHAAIVAWCANNGRKRVGARWEVYGHWSDDPAALRTDVFYSLTPASN